MSKSIIAPIGESGITTGWLQVFSPDLSEALRGDNGLFEAFNADNLAHYKLSMTESAAIAGVYVGALPANLSVSGAYPWFAFDGASSIPRVDGVITFDGANEVTLLSTLNAAVQSLAGGAGAQVSAAVWQDLLSSADFSGAGSVGQLVAAFATLLSLGTADVVINQTTVPWQRVFYAKGTSTVLLAQNLIDIYGQPVTSISQEIAKTLGV